MTSFTRNERRVLRKLKDDPNSIETHELSTIEGLIKSSDEDLCVHILSNLKPVLNIGETSNSIQTLIHPLLERMEASRVGVQLGVIDSLGYLAHLYHDSDAEFNYAIPIQELPDYNSHELNQTIAESDLYYERLICSFYHTTNEVVRKKITNTIGHLVAEYPKELSSKELANQFQHILAEGSPLVAAASAQTLGHFGVALQDPEIFDRLHTALYADNPWVRAGALHGIATMGIVNLDLIQYSKIDFSELIFDGHEIVESKVLSVIESWSHETNFDVNSLLNRLVENKIDDPKNINNLTRLVEITAQTSDIDQEIITRILASVPLEATNPRVCETAGLRLGKLATSDPDKVTAAVSEYQAALHSGDNEEICMGCSALGYVGTREPSLVEDSLNRLKELTTHGSPRVRESSIVSLGLIGRHTSSDPKSLVDTLTACLSDHNSNIRKEAAFAIGAIGQQYPEATQDSIQDLIASIEDDQPEVQIAAAEAIGKIGSKAPSTVTQYVGFLNKRMQDAEIEVRQKIITGIGIIGANSPVIGTETLDTIVEIFADSDKNDRTRARAGRALGQINRRNADIPASCIRKLRKGLDNSNPYVCAASVEAISKISANSPKLVSSAVDTVINKLNNPYSEMDDIFTDGIASICIRYPNLVISAIDPIAELLNADDWTTRKTAAKTLGYIGYTQPSLVYNKDIGKKLVYSVIYGSPFVRINAIRSLGLIGRQELKFGPVAIPTLLDTLMSERPLLRNHSARELPNIIKYYSDVSPYKKLFSQSTELDGKELAATIAAMAQYGVISPLSLDLLLQYNPNGTTEAIDSISHTAVNSPSWVGPYSSIIIDSVGEKFVDTEVSKDKSQASTGDDDDRKAIDQHQPTPETSHANQETSPGYQSPPDEVVSPPRMTISQEDTKFVEKVGVGGEAFINKMEVSNSEVEYVAVREPKRENQHSKSVTKKRINKLITQGELWKEIDDLERTREIYENYDHIVGIIELDKDIGRIYMEYVDKDVGDLLNETPRGLSIEKALWISEGVAKALEVANDLSYCHYDVRPSNVLLYERSSDWEWPKLTDWGMAGTVNDYLDESEIAITTYTAPEQLDATNYSPGKHTDIYQLGVLTFQMISGEKPINELSEDKYKYTLKNGNPIQDAISDYGEISNEIRAGLRKATAPEPSRRFRSVREFKNFLESMRFDD